MSWASFNGPGIEATKWSLEPTQRKKLDEDSYVDDGIIASAGTWYTARGEIYFQMVSKYVRSLDGGVSFAMLHCSDLLT